MLSLQMTLVWTGDKSVYTKRRDTHDFAVRVRVSYIHTHTYIYIYIYVYVDILHPINSSYLSLHIRNCLPSNDHSNISTFLFHLTNSVSSRNIRSLCCDVSGGRSRCLNAQGARPLDQGPTHGSQKNMSYCLAPLFWLDKTWLYWCLYIYMHIHTSMCIYIYIHKYIYTYIQVYIYIYTCPYPCTHTNTYTSYI